jgi:hypothetical protein
VFTLSNARSIQVPYPILMPLHAMPRQIKLKQGLTQRTPHQRTTGPDCLLCSDIINARLQCWIDLHQIHCDKTSALVNALCNEVSFSQCQASSNRCPSARSPHWIQRVDIEGEVNRRIVANVTKSHFHDSADTVSRIKLSALNSQTQNVNIPVNIMHTKCLNTLLP